MRKFLIALTVAFATVGVLSFFLNQAGKNVMPLIVLSTTYLLSIVAVCGFERIAGAIEDKKL